MSGNGMTGEQDFPKYKKIPKADFLRWIDALRDGFSVLGPVRAGTETVFREIRSSDELFMDYKSTMIPPGKEFLFKPIEEILRFEIKDGSVSIEEIKPERKKAVAVGIHPCDMNAILYLDRTFLGAFIDPYYEARRQDTIIIALNCISVSETCFCSSVGTGPYLKADEGYDMLLTDFGEDYLVELKSRRVLDIFRLKGKKTGHEETNLKLKKEQALIKSFKKTISIQSELLMKNLNHPVWKRTAEEKCLSCSNCVMVCPTCFCHNIRDKIEMSLRTVKRLRQWDACQDTAFAEVHGGNYRADRAARLRQFVLHKLNYTEQYGSLGTVGCGRCIKWCPTGIDLTEIAKSIMESNLEKSTTTF